MNLVKSVFHSSNSCSLIDDADMVLMGTPFVVETTRTWSGMRLCVIAFTFMDCCRSATSVFTSRFWYVNALYPVKQKSHTPAPMLITYYPLHPMILSLNSFWNASIWNGSFRSYSFEYFRSVFP